MKSSHTVFVSTTNGMVNAGEARGGQMGEGGRVMLIPSSARPVALGSLPVPTPA